MNSRIAQSICIAVTALVIALLFFTASELVIPAHAQTPQSATHLILKDGSYQSVKKYEVKGERVRYLSAEREEWEELPTSLVDWPATEKYEKERAAAPTIPEAALIHKEAASDREGEELHQPQVSPGLRLPDRSGLFLLDNFKGQPQLVEVEQNEGDLNGKSHILRGALSPIASAKQAIEIEGEHASIYSHVTVPSIYINVEDEDQGPPPGETGSDKPSQPSLDAPRQQAQQPQQAEGPVVAFNRFHIVHVKAKGGKRIVGDIKKTPSGKLSQEQDYVKTTIDRVGSGWLKLTPIEDLAPGEYAIVESRGDNVMNLFIWPFAVKPDAPANQNPWTPK
jgi:hypothetical protein